jgi:hypothetical protein
MDNKVVISWSTSSRDYVLQKTTSFSMPLPFEWMPVTTIPILNGDQYQVEEDIGREAYYRLFKTVPQS